ncbi:DNA ligase-like [Schistocerca gregaria]|uniref:DNA ligase-like n=1 Tax=Schistocerca gregaria TaxID=7010 RepID=UPI00211DF01D|nr:DNA ligase-like [Schistocerca gregaria]
MSVWFRAMLVGRRVSRLSRRPRDECGAAGDDAGRARAAELRRWVRECAKAYYVDSCSLVSDEVYDAALSELRELEEKDPLRRELGEEVGHRPAPDRLVARHANPMLSLSSTRNLEDLRRFDERVRGVGCGTSPEYAVELKYDGVALSLQYREGRLDRVLTRGDGQVGEDVTRASLKYIRTLPLCVPRDYGDFEVRGEAYLLKSEFEKYNNVEGQRGVVYAHARNLASGLLLRKNFEKFEGESVQVCFTAYSLLLLNGGYPASTQLEVLDLLKRIGFHNGEPFVRRLSRIEEFDRVEGEWSLLRPELPFMVDGIVVKVNDLSLYYRLGCTAHAPRYAMAFKFSPERVASTVLGIRLSVGRTGRVTPVALLDPVRVGGVKVSRATLHNREYLEKNHISTGSQILVERSGDVIPKIVGVVGSPASEVRWEPVDWSTCPCEQKCPLKTQNGDVFCTNSTCGQQRLRQLTHFCGALEVDGLGASTVSQLFSMGLVEDIRDVFHLDRHASTLACQRGWGERRVRNLLASVESAKRGATLDKLVFALGIKSVGRALSAKLAERIKSLDTLKNMSQSELQSVAEVGPVVASAVESYFASEFARDLLASLSDVGLLAEVERNESAARQSALRGKNVAFSGTLRSMSRRKAVGLLILCGGRPQSSVSKSTDYLVVADDRPSKKVLDAKKCHVTLLTEEEYLAKLRPP